jgi:hypothetical protein
MFKAPAIAFQLNRVRVAWQIFSRFQFLNDAITSRAAWIPLSIPRWTEATLLSCRIPGNRVRISRI